MLLRKNKTASGWHIFRFRVVAAHLLNHRIERGNGGTGPPIPTSSAVGIALSEEHSGRGPPWPWISPGSPALGFTGQVFQHGIAGVLGLGEGFERRASDPDRATAPMRWTP
jgi:hypothetical protein